MFVHLLHGKAALLALAPAPAPVHAAGATAAVSVVDAALASAAIALLAILMSFAVRVSLSKRSDPAMFWLALSCGFLGLALLLATHAVATLIPGLSLLSPERLSGLAAISISWALTSLGIKHWLMFATLSARKRRLILVATGIVSLLGLAWPTTMMPLLLWWIAVAAWVILPPLRATVSSTRYGGAMVLAAAPLLVGLITDLPQFLGSGRGSRLTLAAMAWFGFVHCSALLRQFIHAQRWATRLSEHLKEEVEVRTRELQLKNERLEEAQVALERANAALQQISITDGLTQVYNRMHFEHCLEQEWRRCARQGALLSVLMIDADYFKRINDSAGHLVGDRCLQEVAAELTRQFRRAGELVARYGGEEFVVLLPDAGHARALALAEGIRAAIERLSLPRHLPGSRLTISVGVGTTIPTADQPPQQLLAAADAALYEAKENGRNRVHSLPLIGGRPLSPQQRMRT